MTAHYLAEDQLLQSAGTDNQRERHARGFLPDDELLTIARAELFKAFEGISRWSASRASWQMKRELKHRKDCSHGVPEPEQAEMAELTPAEWVALRTLERAADLTRSHPWVNLPGHRCEVTTTSHWLTCSGCQAEICRVSAKVTITWAGRDLVREYDLSKETVTPTT